MPKFSLRAPSSSAFVCPLKLFSSSRFLGKIRQNGETEGAPWGDGPAVTEEPWTDPLLKVSKVDYPGEFGDLDKYPALVHYSGAAAAAFSPWFSVFPAYDTTWLSWVVLVDLYSLLLKGPRLQGYSQGVAVPEYRHTIF
jgi:hypothetical protein